MIYEGSRLIREAKDVHCPGIVLSQNPGLDGLDLGWNL